MRSRLCLLRERLGLTYVAEATLGEGHSHVQSEFVCFPIRGTSSRETAVTSVRTTGSPVSYWNSSQFQRLPTGEPVFTPGESLSNIDRDRDRDLVLNGTERVTQDRSTHPVDRL